MEPRCLRQQPIDTDQALSGRRLTDDQRTVNLLHAATRAPAEGGNSLLKTTVKALRRVSPWPWRIGAITAAVLVLLHHAHGPRYMISGPVEPLLGVTC